MNKRQYIRLSTVLAVPALIISFWISQQDFVFNKGQFIECNFSADTDICIHVHLPLSEINDVKVNSQLFTSSVDSNAERLLGVFNFNAPVRVLAYDRYEDKEIDVSALIDSPAFENKSCSFFQAASYLSYTCDEQLLSFTSNSGKIEFIDPNDAIKFNNVVKKGQSYFEDYNLIRVAISFGLFLLFATLYLVFSWLVHYVIYGARIGPQKRRPYQ